MARSGQLPPGSLFFLGLCVECGSTLYKPVFCLDNPDHLICFGSRPVLFWEKVEHFAVLTLYHSVPDYTLNRKISAGNLPSKLFHEIWKLLLYAAEAFNKSLKFFPFFRISMIKTNSLNLGHKLIKYFSDCLLRPK